MWIGIDRKKRQLNPTWGVDRRHPLHMNVYEYIVYRRHSVLYIVHIYRSYNTDISSSDIRRLHVRVRTSVVPLSIRH